VPCAPDLTALLHVHLERFGTGTDGLLFRGVRGGELAASTYCRVWRKARAEVLTPEEARSPLTARPYDLRHAAVSTWLNAGGPRRRSPSGPGTAWGCSTRSTPKCIVGQEDAARKRIAAALAVAPDA
jgi:integrase